MTSAAFVLSPAERAMRLKSSTVSWRPAGFAALAPPGLGADLAAAFPPEPAGLAAAVDVAFAGAEPLAALRASARAARQATGAAAPTSESASVAAEKMGAKRMRSFRDGRRGGEAGGRHSGRDG